MAKVSEIISQTQHTFEHGIWKAVVDLAHDGAESSVMFDCGAQFGKCPTVVQSYTEREFLDLMVLLEEVKEFLKDPPSYVLVDNEVPQEDAQ